MSDFDWKSSERILGIYTSSLNNNLYKYGIMKRSTKDYKHRVHNFDYSDFGAFLL